MSGVVTPTFQARWAGAKYIGIAKPKQVVKIQRGVMDRAYRSFIFLDGSVPDDFGYVSGGKNADRPWQGFWRATGDWMTVPNVREVSLEQTFDENGTTSATVSLENSWYQEVAGVAGIYHRVRKGYLAPWYGWATWGRPEWDAPRNEWFEVFNSGAYRVTVLQGYGDALVPTFTGLIDESKVRATPAEIVVTARDFTQMLTDQRVFGNNKDPQVKSPVVFSDRLKADDVEAVGGGAKASSSDAGNPAKNVTVTGTDKYWLSQGHSDASATEWVQVSLKKGRYETVFIDPHYAGMEVYLSIFARGDTKVDGVAVADGFISRDLGKVPGAQGGHPFVKKWASMDSIGKSYSLGFKLECGEGTTLRLSFRNLKKSPGKGDYRAGCSRLAAMKRTRKAEAKKNKWVLVNDAADVVRWALMWAGFHEWVVEDFGVKLKDNLVFHQADFLIDIVNKMKEQGDYVFFMGSPSEHVDSIGVPHFVRNQAVAPPPGGMLEVTENHQIIQMEPSFSKESLAYIIRTRGRMTQKGEKRGQPLGEDSVKRVMAVYQPPWSGAHRNVLTGAYDMGITDRLGGLRKHVVHVDNNLDSEAECMMACVLIALQEALASFTGTLTIPGHNLALNDQISVVDTPSGTNSRLWIGSRQTTFTVSEEDTSWTMSMGGSIIDTPDVFGLAVDYWSILEKVRTEAAEAKKKAK